MHPTWFSVIALDVTAERAREIAEQARFADLRRGRDDIPPPPGPLRRALSHAAVRLSIAFARLVERLEGGPAAEIAVHERRTRVVA